MKPSPSLAARHRFTTKQVGRGFYRGNRTGSMGAHTEYGGYVIDWRKVRHYNVPDLTNFKLTPFVSKTIDPRKELPRQAQGHRTVHYEPKRVDPWEFLSEWKRANEDGEEYEWLQDIKDGETKARRWRLQQDGKQIVEKRPSSQQRPQQQEDVQAPIESTQRLSP